MSAYADVAQKNIYKGESYKLIKRELWSYDGIRKVWIWEITSGPAKGMDGGKCSTKAEAMYWVKYMINAGIEGKLF